jgi:hypothetical protein
MYGGRLFTTIGLIRQARPGGFCPACRVLMKARDTSQELANPLVAAYPRRGPGGQPFPPAGRGDEDSLAQISFEGFAAA